MENDLHINKRLEKQKIAEIFAQRGTIPADDGDKLNEFSTTLIYELVMNTRYIAPVTLVGEGDAQELSFQLVKNPQGTHFFPLFTSSEDFEKWVEAKDSDTVQLQFDNYAIMLSNKDNNNIGGIAINPFTDNYCIDKRMVAEWYERKQMIVKGHANNTITKDSKYEIYALDPEPTELCEKLRESAKELPEVKRVWLRGINLDGKDAYLAVVDLTGDKQKLIPALGNAVRNLLNGKLIHFVDYAPGFGEDAVKDVQPIYAKES